MIDNNAKNRELVQRTVNSMRMVAILSLITNVYQLYDFFNKAGHVRQMLSIALGIAGTILIWQLAKQLQAGKKQSLHYWLMVIAVGMIRWIFVDAVFDLNILSIILISMIAIFTMRMTVWVRSEVLTKFSEPLSQNIMSLPGKRPLRPKSLALSVSEILRYLERFVTQP